MSEQSNNNHFGNNGQWIFMASIAMLAIIVLVTSFLTYQNMKALSAEVVALKQSSLDPSSASFKEAVTTSIESYVNAKQDAVRKAKFSKYANAEEGLTDNERVYGNPKARFTIVEYSDLECPYCKRFHDTPKEIVDASKGNINWQWKDFPLSMHGKTAIDEALAAKCVSEQNGNRAFWVFIDEVFGDTRTNGGGVTDLDGLIEGVGADTDKVRSCMEDPDTRKALSDSLAKGTSLGITGTPAVFIVDNVTGNNHMLQGAQPASAIVSVIRQMYDLANKKDDAKVDAKGEATEQPHSDS